MNGVATTTETRPNSRRRRPENAGPQAPRAMVWKRMMPNRAHLISAPDRSAETGLGLAVRIREPHVHRSEAGLCAVADDHEDEPDADDAGVEPVGGRRGGGGGARAAARPRPRPRGGAR